MKLTIDRIEGEWAVCEYEKGKTLNLPSALLPADAREGDVLRLTVDHEATDERKVRAEELRNRLFHRSKEEDR